MTTNTRTFGLEAPTPIPPRQLLWYRRFWHVVYLGALALLLGSSLVDAWPALGWRQVALAALVGVQVALYLRFFVYIRRWPLPWWWLTTYFVGSLAVWFVEWQLDERFFWLVMSYLGQMFGTLPPIAAIPGATLIYFFVTGRSTGWELLWLVHRRPDGRGGGVGVLPGGLSLHLDPQPHQ
jgi:hypothetical protein